MSEAAGLPAPAAVTTVTSPDHAGRVRSGRMQRTIAAQVHVTAALIMAAALFWKAGQQLDAIGSVGFQVLIVLAAGVAAIGAVVPWLAPQLSPSAQRVLIWSSLMSAAVPATATVTFIGFAAVGGCQLVVIAGVFAEIGARRRMLPFLWAVAGVTFAITLWHLLAPLV